MDNIFAIFPKIGERRKKLSKSVFGYSKSKKKRSSYGHEAIILLVVCFFTWDMDNPPISAPAPYLKTLMRPSQQLLNLFRKKGVKDKTISDTL